MVWVWGEVVFGPSDPAQKIFSKNVQLRGCGLRGRNATSPEHNVYTPIITLIYILLNILEDHRRPAAPQCLVMLTISCGPSWPTPAYSYRGPSFYVKMEVCAGATQMWVQT